MLCVGLHSLGAARPTLSTRLQFDARDAPIRSADLQLLNASYEIRYPVDQPQFCSNHACGHERNQDGISPHTCCPLPCRALDDTTPHFLYIHVQKTGGSSIECAWQAAADAGKIDLLGHSSHDVHDECAARCEAAGVPTRTLITVRNPYDYWASLYRYTWQCIYGDCGSASASFVAADPTAHVHLHVKWLPPSQQHGVLHTFTSFLEYANASTMFAPYFSQGHHIKTECGEPCRCVQGL